MYSVHALGLVVLLSCNICLVNLTAVMKSLMPIFSRKVEIRHDFVSAGLEFYPNGSCVSLPAASNNSTDTLYVDLFTEYPIHLVILRGKVLSHKPAAVSVRLDNQTYKSISFSRESKFSQQPVRSGRVLSISTGDTISVCFIEIYTCKTGRKGAKCNEECTNGFYGLACKEQCKCPQSETCDKKTGVCAAGCMPDSRREPEVCYSPLVKVAHLDQFSISETPAISITQGPTKDLLSATVYEPSKQCISVSTECESRSLYLELDFPKPIVLYGVEMTFTKFHLPAPFSIFITSDGKPCYGSTAQTNSLKLGKYVFKCQRQKTIGQYILARFTTYNKTAKMNVTGVGLNVCNFKALECSTGLYGRNCRQLCSCADNDCDKVTGSCPHGHCGVTARGPYCSSIDILPNQAIVLRKKYYDSRSDNSPSYNRNPATPNSRDSYPSWLAIELDGVYFINSFTLTLEDEADDPHRAIRVYRDPNISIDSFSVGVWHEWPGLPCVVREPGKGSVSHHLPCPGLARTIVLVVLSDSSFLDVSSATIHMWTCVDGMFGSECEHRCNCMDALERCNKGSGSCLSGCARGFKGRDCLQVCEVGDLDPTCPTRTCHCQGSHQADCGPEVAICTRGCQPGWMGLSCTLPCPKGYFGINCEGKCGNCRHDNPIARDGTCFLTNGTCPLGCADPSDSSATCHNHTAPSSRNQSSKEKKGNNVGKNRLERVLENSSVKVVLGLLGVITLCSALVMVVCCSLRCYWERVAHNKRLKEKRVEMIVRRALSPKMDNKIQGDHQVYHEAFLKRSIMNHLGEQNNPTTKTAKARAKAKAEAIRLMILEMESQRRLNRGATGDEQEDEEQDPDQKVALWILKQDFYELIERRRKRLRDYPGDILHIVESPYRISEVSLIPDIHKLYDDIEHLGIP